MLKKNLIIITMILIGLLVIGGNVRAAEDKKTSTSTINGITANWEYILNNNKIENLVCTNATELSGKLTIPSTIDGYEILTIGADAFESATNITEVTIPNSVTSIGAYAFNNCNSLNKINFGTGVTTLTSNAFYNCTALTSIYIPKNIENISLPGLYVNGPFAGCVNIKNVTFEDGIESIPDHISAIFP